MKKGVVVEAKRRHYIMLTSDGSFYKAKIDQEVQVGEEVSFTPVEERSVIASALNLLQSRSQWKALAMVVLCLALIFPFFTWFNQNETHAYAYINLDINPSIEFTVDDSYDIIDAEPLNDDGSSMLSEIGDYKGESLETVSSSVISLSRDLGYLDNDRQVLLGVSYVDQVDERQLLNSLSNQLLDEFDQDINIASFEVSKDLRDEAIKENTSMNVMYATEVLYGDSREEQEDQDEAVVSEQVSTDDENGEQENKSEQNERIEEVLARFLDRTNRDELPPGLKKKIDEDRLEELLEEADREQDDEQEDRSNEEDSNNDEREDQADEKKEEKSNNGSNGKQQRNENQGNGNGNGNNNGQSQDEDESNKDDEHPVFGEDGPPGQRDGEDHPGQGKGNNGFTPPGQDDNFVPPGQQKKNDD
ncbi:anti-sigma-I factor RsgI family protein [Alkalibacillus haloalkaliphilus]|uniref:anti-sigma-I factor RsgI family protein n=1 Tax=Alkalibacillus haloalkaliphilus TaxID=94136 RepID=UPI002936D48C|nr:anti-sigma factor domain-containing protein [Alkalibacillus haloalkaliphilus]MDV2582483.1 anti-sigma factor domain-containing protein [Alkalibacillus haloalkaliphilus]